MAKREEEELRYLRIELDREKYKKIIKTKKLSELMEWLIVLRPRVYEKAYQEKKDDFLLIIEEIKKEIPRRIERGEKIESLKDISDERPETGLLKVMGYKVGNDGESTQVRRDILEAIYRGPIPHVHSIAYMEEWGKDGTKKRFNKLRNTLWGLRNRMRSSADLAREHYTNDIKWLDENKNTLITQDDD